MQQVSKQPNYSHDRLQQECGKYLWNNYPQTRRTFFHCPNEQRPFEGESKAAFIKRLSMAKSIWVLPGVVDLLWYWKGTLYMFDIKVGKDSIKEAQWEFIHAMQDQGGKFYEINNLQRFKDISDEILS